MLYGFTTGYGSCMVTQGAEGQRKDSLGGSAKSSNFLQVKLAYFSWFYSFLCGPIS